MADEKNMDPAEFRRRLKEFALRTIRLTQSLPNNQVARAIKGQLVRAGTSPGANYRAACRARSRAEFVARMGIVEEELDESLYWMELLIEACIVKPGRLEPLMTEGEELLSMTVSSIKTARVRKR